MGTSAYRVAIPSYEYICISKVHANREGCTRIIGRLKSRQPASPPPTQRGSQPVSQEPFWTEKNLSIRWAMKTRLAVKSRDPEQWSPEIIVLDEQIYEQWSPEIIVLDEQIHEQWSPEIIVWMSMDVMYLSITAQGEVFWWQRSKSGLLWYKMSHPKDQAKCSLYAWHTANGESVWRQLFYLFGPIQRQLCAQQLCYPFRK